MILGTVADIPRGECMSGHTNVVFGAEVLKFGGRIVGFEHGCRSFPRSQEELGYIVMDFF